MTPARYALVRAAGLLLVSTVMTGSLYAQAEGAIGGRIRDASDGRSLAGVEVLLDTRVGGISDTAGEYRIRGARPGWHRVAARLIGYRVVVLDSVLVRAGATVTADFALSANPLQLEPLVVTAPVDELLDPLATASEQKITAADLRELPVSSLEEAVALSAGAVGTSYRGGRIGEESFILDGLGIKNQVDAANGGLGLQLPPDFLGEASLVTNAFSARYGQALSGLVNVVTRDPDKAWEGRVAYETDRPFGGSLDRGLDRLAARAGGPIAGGVGFVAAIDVAGRMDQDAVAAPAPTDPRDPRSGNPYPLPHNSGEQWNGAGKIFIPISSRADVRVLGVHSEDQRLLFDPAYKYDAELAPAQRLRGDLVSVQGQYRTDPRSATPIILDIRASRFVREFLRGTLTEPVDYTIGALTGSRFHFMGEDLARAQSTSPEAIPGLRRPDFSTETPWGVPAFFLGGAPSGDLAYNRYGESRAQLDLTLGLHQVDLYAGGDYSAQQVRTWQRALGYLPAIGGVPGPASSAFSPTAAAAYIEAQARLADLAITTGIRYDQFDAGSGDLANARGAKRSVSPRFAVSTVLRGATLVASFGRFSQAPDYQFLVDAAFDDTTRTGRFRRGNPDVGFEQATQYEFSLRIRPREAVSLRAGVYVRRLDGLIASVPLGLNPDSTIFGNADAGTVKGLELLAEREFTGWFGFRVAYTLQKATSTSTDPFLLNRLIVVDPTTGDTTRPAHTEFPLDYDRRHNLILIGRARANDGWGPRVAGVRPLAGLEGSVILRVASGLPYTRVANVADTVDAPPNDARLPATSTLDMLVRRPIALGHLRGGIYVDVRNLLNRRNILAVRRDTGEPGPTETIVNTLAEAALAAHPEPIPFESPRYRPAADLDHNGYVEEGELLPMYLAAARDFTTPIFAYGTPRLVRLGMEFVF